MSKQPKRAKSLEYKRSYVGYAFIGPFIIGIVFVFIPMIVQTVLLSFNHVILPSSQESYSLKFAGLKYYIEFFTKDAWFMQLTWNTVQNSLIDFVCILFFSFFIAVLLNQKFKGRSLARVIFFIPVIILSGVIGLVDSGNLASSVGSLDSMVDVGAQTSIALPTVADLLQKSNILASRPLAIITAVIDRMPIMTTFSGVQILLFLSGLQAISPSVYEAASIEGCSGWETFWLITLPMMSPMILLNSVYTLIDTFTNSNNALIVALLNSTKNLNYSYAATRSVIYLIILGFFVGLLFLTGRKIVFYRE